MVKPLGAFSNVAARLKSTDLLVCSSRWSDGFLLRNSGRNARTALENFVFWSDVWRQWSLSEKYKQSFGTCRTVGTWGRNNTDFNISSSYHISAPNFSARNVCSKIFPHHHSCFEQVFLLLLMCFTTSRTHRLCQARSQDESYNLFGQGRIIYQTVHSLCIFYLLDISTYKPQRVPKYFSCFLAPNFCF